MHKATAHVPKLQYRPVFGGGGGRDGGESRAQSVSYKWSSATREHFERGRRRWGRIGGRRRPSNCDSCVIADGRVRWEGANERPLPRRKCRPGHQNTRLRYNNDSAVPLAWPEGDFTAFGALDGPRFVGYRCCGSSLSKALRPSWTAPREQKLAPEGCESGPSVGKSCQTSATQVFGPLAAAVGAHKRVKTGRRSLCAERASGPWCNWLSGRVPPLWPA